MYVALFCALVGWLQPPAPSPQPPAASPQPIPQTPVGQPATGGYGGTGQGKSNFGTGVFPLGATWVVAQPNGLVIETIESKTVVMQQTRNVEVTGPDGQRRSIPELYTIQKAVFVSVKQPLPPETQIYRNGKLLSPDEKSALHEPTPIFITMLGSPNAVPGKGYEKIIGNHLVAFIPPAAPTHGGPVMPPKTQASLQFGKVAGIDSANGAVKLVIEHDVTYPETKTATKKEQRTITENGETKTIQVDIPYTYTVMATSKVLKEAVWRASDGSAFESNGQPLRPASAALEKLKQGDPVAWMLGPLPPDLLKGPQPKPFKLILTSPMPKQMVPGVPRAAPPMPVGSPPMDTPLPNSPAKDGGAESAEVKDVVAKVNEARAAAGLAPLQVDATLMKAARQHSSNMAKQGRLEHFLDGKGPRDRLVDLGLQPSHTGENCAQGQHSAADAMQSWMNSPGHRGNILNASYTHIGIGKADGPGGPYWTQVFASFSR